MILSLAITHTYQSVDIGLFNNGQLVDQISETTVRASKYFGSVFDELLTKNGILLKEIAFIGANQGPGPFTTLRVIIASLNGLSFATNIPLIGINGLEAFAQEYHDAHYPYTMIVLNAFGKDVYFSLDFDNKEIETGYKNCIELLQEISMRFPAESIRCIGSGVYLYENEIKNYFGNRAIIPTDLPEQCSVQHIGIMAYDAWQKRIGLTQHLLPLYLKQQQFATAQLSER